MKAVFNYKGKKIEIDLKKCEGFEKMWGLMFTRRENASNLLFEFNKSVAVPIHSFFCGKFIAIWLDEENKVIEIKEVVPWKFSVLPSRKFKKLIEVPINKKNKEIIKILLNK